MADGESGPIYTNDGQVLNVPAGASGVQPGPDISLPKPDPAAFNGSLAQARERLNQIYGDEKLKSALLSGTPGLTREWHELNRVIVANSESVQAGPIETTDSVSDPNALSSRDRAGMMDEFRSAGMPQRLEDYVNLMQRDPSQVELPSQGDGVVAKQVWDRLTRNPEFRQKVLSGDPQALETKMLLSGLRAYAQADGRPVSPVVQEFLRQRGLR